MTNQFILIIISAVVLTASIFFLLIRGKKRYINENGIGIYIDDILDMLDADKIINVLDVCWGFNEYRMIYQKCVNHSNKDKLKIIIKESKDYYESCGLATIICEYAHYEFLSHGRLNNKSYLYYEPMYPWEVSEEDFKSEKEVIDYICNLVMQFTLPNVSEDIIRKKIGYINETRCIKRS